MSANARALSENAPRPCPPGGDGGAPSVAAMIEPRAQRFFFLRKDDAARSPGGDEEPARRDTRDSNGTAGSSYRRVEAFCIDLFGPDGRTRCTPQPSFMYFPDDPCRSSSSSAASDFPWLAAIEGSRDRRESARSQTVWYPIARGRDLRRPYPEACAQSWKS